MTSPAISATVDSARSRSAGLLTQAQINRLLKAAMVFACEKWRATYLEKRFTWPFANANGYATTRKAIARKAQRIARRNAPSAMRDVTKDPRWKQFIAVEAPLRHRPRGSSRADRDAFWRQMIIDFRAKLAQQEAQQGPASTANVRPLVLWGDLSLSAFSGKIRATAQGAKGVSGTVPIPVPHPIHRKVSMVLKALPNDEIEAHAAWFAQRLEASLNGDLSKARIKAREKQRKVERTEQRKADTAARRWIKRAKERAKARLEA